MQLGDIDNAQIQNQLILILKEVFLLPEMEISTLAAIWK